MFGIDVSNNNPTNTVDWTGVEFVGIKASEGVSFTDKLFDTYVQQAVQRGVLWFPYHFAHPDVNTAQAEVEFFLSKFSHLTPTWPPALDFETRPGVNPLNIMGAEAAAVWINEFLSRLFIATGWNGLFYTFRDYAKSLYPRVDPRWPKWLATAVGSPQYPTFRWMQTDYPIAIEQWGQINGIDANESYIDLTPHPPTPHLTKEDPMQPIVMQDGTVYVFIVGTDHAVWRLRFAPGSTEYDKNTDGQPAWASMGGQVGSPVT